MGVNTFIARTLIGDLLLECLLMGNDVLIKN